MFSALYAIIASFHNSFITACIAIYFSILFDISDGIIARLIHAKSSFGAEYDSLWI